MVSEALLFASTFALVFLLGLQFLNVNGGHYVAAFMTSFGISLSQLILYKLMPDASLSEIVAYMSGAPFGIVLSMYVHRRTIGRRREPGPDLHLSAEYVHLPEAARHGLKERA